MNPAGRRPEPAAASPRRRRLALGLAGAALAGCAVPPPRPPAPPPAPATGEAGAPPSPPLPPVARFSAADPGRLPAGWVARPVPGRRPTEYAVVAFEGRHVLQARSDAGAGALVHAVDADPEATPWLEWQWRTDAIIAGATVADPRRDDAPLRLAVVFGATRLVYVWDGMAALDRTIEHPGARAWSVVVETGGERTGRWLSYRRNLIDDHRRITGELPGRVTAIELSTDADDLRTQVLAWYGDVRLA